MKLKTRLYLIKRSFRRIFTPYIRKELKSNILIFITIIGLILFGAMEYQIGYIQATEDIANKHETDIPMCAYKDTAIRENPTGYILSDINRGDVVWVVQLQVPFAVVWYFNGSEWNLGTTTASYLVPCDRITKDAL